MLMRLDPMHDVDRLAASPFDHGETPQAIPMDAYRRRGEVVIDLDLPGVDRDSIDVTVEQSVLTVTAHRDEDRDGVDDVVAQERPHGELHRRVLLGDGLDTRQLDASYERGVLHITIPVEESLRPRRVPVARSDGGMKAIDAATD